MRNLLLNRAVCSLPMALAALAAAQLANSQTFNLVHTFSGADGATPFANLLLNGTTLYGTTSGGGAHNAGAVFTVNTTTNTEAVLHSFAGGAADGADPIGGVIRDPSGNLYGTTAGGGAHFLGDRI